MTFSTFASPGVSLQGGGGSGGGGGTPGGSNTQIQYNNSGAFAGASGLTTNGTELTIASGTKTADAPVLDMSQTWNNAAVTFTGLKFNVISDTSAAASLLMDLQVGGTSQSGIDKNGNAHFGTYRGFIGAYGGQTYSGTPSGTSVYLPQLGGFTFYNANGGSLGGRTIDTFLTRRAAANLRLGAADAAAPVAQTLSVQSVVAGTTNTAGANLTITGSQGTGTGAGGSIIFQVAPAGGSGTAQNALSTALTIDSTQRVIVNNNVIGNVGAAGTGSIIKFGTTGPVPIVSFRNAADSAGAEINVERVTVSAGGYVYWNGRSSIYSPADGIFQLVNNAVNDFNRLQFGGTSSSFPALKRNGAGIDVVGADGTNVSFIRVPGVAVASLPAAATAGVGARSFVTDATATTYASTVAGGGANKVPVYSDGTNWLIG
jgi:hypothetical protein